MATPTFESSRARAMWRTCLASALRTALACTIVGVATLFGPQYIKKQVAFPAFSYVAVILVVTDATLGDTFRGCWLALYATIQGVCPAILSLWLIGPARLTAGTTAIAVALSAFVVVLPENTHLIAKRIALGQIVLVYVIAYINGGQTETIMHPVHVAASTGLGVVACVLALIFPYPCLACCEVKQNCKLFAENASERFNLFVKAFTAEDNSCALAFISQAKSLVKTGSKLLQGIKTKQESMKWERFPFKFLRPYGENPGSRFEDVQTPLRGMEIALDNSPSFPVEILNSDQKSVLHMLGEHIPKQVNNMSLESSATVPESNQENTQNKDNGFWAGLPVAISLAGSREATFKVANVKAQGTVLGTIYGILGCFVFEKYVQIRFLSLLPWFIVSSFLRQSTMYGQAGGLSAIIGALLILGRKGFGLPSEFAIARITETFIGLSCSIIVEILLQPTRATTLAKLQLSKSFEILNESISLISFGSIGNLVESQNKLKSHIIEMGKFIAEAEAEPNFWFVPFHSVCYRKLMGSLTKMLEYLHFGSQAFMLLEQESGGSIDNFVHKLDGDIKLFKDFVGSSMKCFEEVSLVKSLEILDKEFEKKKLSVDVELGTSQSSSCCNIIRYASEEEIDENFRSYFEHSKEFVDQIVNGEELKGQVVLSLSALGFCMDGLVKETKEIEKAIKEVVQWENPSSHVNLHDISCKVRGLANIIVAN
ncbi:hypothetical protein KY290_029289 [Solanum tuberosum]|uniref:Integral membrane bound transporter domain-containing protein n=1 Tax=Solanum tuberosum TaxID=4113 RepID=A0ABQ7UKC6_SOLTU|nr:hypothetical protein KY290_029289 [Solanum tuberosum]